MILDTLKNLNNFFPFKYRNSSNLLIRIAR